MVVRLSIPHVDDMHTTEAPQHMRHCIYNIWCICGEGEAAYLEFFLIAAMSAVRPSSALEILNA